MATEITVQNADEFQQMVDNRDFRISEAIVKGILKNINSKRKNVHVLSVTCLEEDSTFDITLERKHFAQTLQENLPHYIERELYEDCIKINECISKLNQK